MKIIYIGAGCFWGVEKYYSKIKGVANTEVGYANGPVDKATYEEVCNALGHSEVARVEFDEKILSIQDLFDSYIRIIDPYSLNKQGNDIGIQYCVGLYSSDNNLLNSLKECLKTWEKNNDESVIEITSIKNYVTAEENHQEYLDKNKSGYCHINLNNIPNYLKNRL
ncbi:peptide-methionine (S)-S-oxide reductase MsrA [Candidatus Mycoplasma mahonii]|uniref:peptide-methionine (S)-S-oxide reductase MsrA n=1 Tax=Candidatus Mycoplasma mahonii TaxID=3004105 RepID=UPI0026EC312D|nr:peptide-methionine (S)-S-oxide reductase MsrA [Candidatus Mycoplasma mahonii]WKX02644.1 peptide-methionine (S)-S-oxide reductase MsrA [Candidatus Mycoplasma mahonii]